MTLLTTPHTPIPTTFQYKLIQKQSVTKTIIVKINIQPTITATINTSTCSYYEIKK